MKISKTLIGICAIFAAIAFTQSSKAAAIWYLNENGQLINTGAAVLGEDDDEDRSGSDSGSDSSGSGSGGSESSDDDTDEPEAGDAPEAEDDEIEDEDEDEQDEARTEIRIESRDGRLIIRRRIESGDEENEEELGEQSIFEIRERIEARTTRIATGSGNTKIIIRTHSAARTNFPLSVNPETNELIVTTPAGTKVVAILPDQAVANLLANNIIDRVVIEDETETELEENDDLAEVEDLVELEEEDGTLIYTISGEKDERALGLFRVKIKKTVSVSAETGEVLQTEQSLLQRLLDLISF